MDTDLERALLEIVLRDVIFRSAGMPALYTKKSNLGGRAGRALLVDGGSRVA